MNNPAIATPVFAPTVAGQTPFIVTATSPAGCAGTATLLIKVINVRCGNNNSGISMCYQGNTVCVAPYLVPTYQRYGATLGACGDPNLRISYEPQVAASDAPLALSVKAYPNPTSGMFSVEMHSPVEGSAQFDVLDAAGRPVQQRMIELTEGLNQTNFDLKVQPTGNYLIRCRDSLGRQAVVRVSKQ